MAALDRRNPNLDDFVGLNWSCWVDRVNILPSDVIKHYQVQDERASHLWTAGSDTEDCSKYGRSHSETMTLRKEDMHIFGHCPAHDEIYLVVCGHCGQVVKPQAFEKHCERRHGPFTMMCGQLPTLAPQPRPRPGLPPSNLSSRERQKDGRCHEAVASFSLALPVHRPTKAQKEAVSFPSVKKFPQENPPLPHNTSSTLRQRVPSWHTGSLSLGHCSFSTSPPERATVRKPTAGRCSDSHSPLRGTRTYSRTDRNINKKECDLNKHCRVQDPERKKLYSQELICNTDSIHQQQKAVRKTKITSDQLAEQRSVSAGQDMVQPLVKSKDKEKHLEAVEEKKATKGSNYNLNSNCHILSLQSRSRDPTESFPEEEDNSTVQVEIQPPYPFNQGLFSSEESEEDEQEETTDLPATPWHPKPLGLCTFGCRPLGCSIFTFDRRWHHLRFALSAMLEQHVSTHLWKKMPQVSSGLMSGNAQPPAVGSPVRTVARPFNSTGPLSLHSTSVGRLETKSSQHNSQGTEPSSSNTSTSFGPGRRRNPVGRLKKAQPMKEEFMQDESAAQKAAKLSYSEDKPSKYVRDPSLNEKGQPQVASYQGTTNGNFSHRKKSCPSLRRPPRNRGRFSGIQQKVVGFDNRSLSQKRKGSNESPLLSSALSSKCQRLSSPSSSSHLARKGENIRDMHVWGLEEREDS